MKPCLCCLLAVLCCLSLLGCQSPEDNIVSFYYSRDPVSYQYFAEDGVIRSENRDLTGHRSDLRYMVGLYLAGPLEEGLTVPFTKSTRLLSVTKQASSITVELSDCTNAMTASDFSLACACLMLTCADFTDCTDVTVVSGEWSITMDADSILLYDPLPRQETKGE